MVIKSRASFVEPTAGVAEASVEDLHRVVATNLTGVWLCMKYEIPAILKCRRGT